MSGEADAIDPFVIDNGSWMCKAGYAGGKTAQAYEHTIIGTPEKETRIGTRSEFIGEQAYVKREILSLRNPMERGVVTNWEDMERFWEYIFIHGLRDGVEDRTVLITEVPHGNMRNRQNMVEILMEKFRVSQLYITDPASLALFSSGRTTGVVLDVGGSVTHTASLVKGSKIKQQKEAASDTIEVSNIGGNDVTGYLAGMIQNQGIHVQSKSKQIDVEELKHYMSSWSYLTDQSETKEEYRLPDDTSIRILPEMASCSDALFKPSLIGSDAKGISTLLHHAIAECDPSIQTELYSNIILSGGATMSPGLEDKIKHDLLSARTAVNSTNMDIKIVSPPERSKSSWLGGSIIASLSEFPKMCKTRQYYFEHGWSVFQTFPDSETVKNS